MGSQKNRSILPAVLAGTIAALVLSGCSSLDPDNVSNDDRTLVWTTGTSLGTLDVVADQVNGTARRLLLGNVVEGLTRVTKTDDGLDWKPLLATRWQRIKPTVWRFDLRKGVKFQDGSAMDAKDVAYSVNKLASPDSAKDSTLENIKGASVVSKYAVDVETRSPDFYTYRVLASVGVQPDGWGKDADEAQNTAIGTGPYQVTDVSDSHDQAVLEPYDDYWGDVNPYYSRVEMSVVPDTGARLAGLKANESDVAFDLSPDLLDAAPATVTSESTEVDVLRISDRTEALSDERVRQALNYAVDRSTFIDDIRFGFAKPPHGQGVTSQVYGYNPDLDDYPYDPDKAAELVKDAGAEGTKLTMMCVSEYYGTVGTDTCQTLAQAYRDIGLDIDVQLLPRDQWVDQGLLATQNKIPPPDLFYVQAGSGTLDSTLYVSSYYTCGDVRATLCDPKLRDAAEHAMAITDPDKQAEAYAKVHAIAHDVAPMVWITNPENAVAAQSGISGELYSDAYTVYWDEWHGEQ